MTVEFMLKSSIAFASSLLVVGLLGGLMPLLSNLKERGLHSLLALGTGMLLGTIFLHMLPEAMSDHRFSLLVLFGLMIIFIVERLVFGQNQPSTHSLIGLTAFFGLSIHAVMVGFSLSFTFLQPETQAAFLISILIHKFSETFALTSVFMLAGYSKAKSVKLILIFSLFTPISLLLGKLLVKSAASIFIEAAAAVATGTFLYVAVVDLLPEVFHHPRGRWRHLIALLVGVMVIALIIDAGNFTH